VPLPITLSFDPFLINCIRKTYITVSFYGHKALFGDFTTLVSHYSPKLVECGNFSCYWLDQENRGTKIAQDGILDNPQQEEFCSLGNLMNFPQVAPRVPREPNQ